MINLILNNSRNKKSTFSSLISYNLYLTHTHRVSRRIFKIPIFQKDWIFASNIILYFEFSIFSHFVKITSFSIVQRHTTFDINLINSKKNILCSNEWERISWKFWEKSRDLHTIIYKSLIVNRKGIKSRRNSSKIEISNLECIYISGR